MGFFVSKVGLSSTSITSLPFRSRHSREVNEVKDEVSVVNGGRNRGTNVTRNRSHLLHSSCRPVSLRSLFVLSSGHVTRATCEGDAAVGLVSKPEGNSRH